jgi:hypothetical protein
VRLERLCPVPRVRPMCRWEALMSGLEGEFDADAWGLRQDDLGHREGDV